MKIKRVTVIFYVLVMGFAIGYWAGQENAQVEGKVQTVRLSK